MLKSDSLKRFSPMKSVYVCEYNFFTFYNLWFSDFVIFFLFQIKEEGMIGNFLTLFYRKDNFLIRLISKFSCFIQPYSRLLSYIFLSRKKHFTCSEHDPRCSLVHTFHADQQLFTHTAFYPVTWFFEKKTTVTQSAYYPGPLVPVHKFLCTCTMLFYYSPKYMSLFYSNPQGGCGGWTTIFL